MLLRNQLFFSFCEKFFLIQKNFYWNPPPKCFMSSVSCFHSDTKMRQVLLVTSKLSVWVFQAQNRRCRFTEESLIRSFVEANENYVFDFLNKKALKIWKSISAPVNAKFSFVKIHPGFFLIRAYYYNRPHLWANLNIIFDIFLSPYDELCVNI